jgi:hypothetical protein
MRRRSAGDENQVAEVTAEAITVEVGMAHLVALLRRQGGRGDRVGLFSRIERDNYATPAAALAPLLRWSEQGAATSSRAAARTSY